MPEIAIIFIGIVVGLCVIGLSVNGIVQKVFDFKRDQNRVLHGEKTAPANDLADRTDMIEDRLQVLERLATDRGSLLADEIDALRANTPALAQHSAKENGLSLIHI